MIDIANLRKLLADATPGPWVYSAGGGHAYNSIEGSESIHTNGRERTAPGGRSTASWTNRICENLSDPELPGPAANIALILAAKNALPELLDELERLQGLEARLLGAIVKIGNRMNDEGAV